MSIVISKKIDLFTTTAGQVGVVTETLTDYDVDDLVATRTLSQALLVQFRVVGQNVDATKTLPAAFRSE